MSRGAKGGQLLTTLTFNVSSIEVLLVLRLAFGQRDGLNRGVVTKTLTRLDLAESAIDVWRCCNNVSCWDTVYIRATGTLPWRWLEPWEGISLIRSSGRWLHHLRLLGQARYSVVMQPRGWPDRSCGWWAAKLEKLGF